MNKKLLLLLFTVSVASSQVKSMDAAMSPAFANAVGASITAFFATASCAVLSFTAIGINSYLDKKAQNAKWDAKNNAYAESNLKKLRDEADLNKAIATKLATEQLIKEGNYRAATEIKYY